LHVKALLRDPSKLPEHLRSNVEVVQGDVTSDADVLQTVEGQDAVVVTLGTRNDLGKLLLHRRFPYTWFFTTSEVFILVPLTN
jgi:uncharacterized protein YbjT (DUF2867 family)